MTYVKMQYELYIDYIHTNNNINEKMKIDLLNTMVGKLQETMTNIIVELGLSNAENPKIQKKLEIRYNELKKEYESFKLELEKVKTEANKLYNSPQPAKGGKSRRKRKKNEGKYSRKGNRKI